MVWFKPKAVSAIQSLYYIIAEKFCHNLELKLINRVDVPHFLPTRQQLGFLKLFLIVYEIKDFFSSSFFFQIVVQFYSWNVDASIKVIFSRDGFISSQLFLWLNFNFPVKVCFKSHFQETLLCENKYFRTSREHFLNMLCSWWECHSALGSGRKISVRNTRKREEGKKLQKTVVINRMTK